MESGRCCHRLTVGQTRPVQTGCGPAELFGILLWARGRDHVTRFQPGAGAKELIPVFKFLDSVILEEKIINVVISQITVGVNIVIWSDEYEMTHLENCLAMIFIVSETLVMHLGQNLSRLINRRHHGSIQHRKFLLHLNRNR
jgi:hypothetical protein